MYVIIYHNLGLRFVEIMSILIVPTAMHVLTFCFEIFCFSSQEFFSLAGEPFHLELDTAPSC